ncbi:hypothetical protein HYPSUDRAFT_528788 [Hypholoma sublateritium FD-334 SS-4]|uniref:Cyanovirin-N domain-containing protein n=1 Tax=Hypholoma sublateritium (strain FD-334 SS-4) TaxID=945553 RepID=A0A0D2MKW6_HYPSF|nr:hypothetical protein HYPSUDRAFT_528788 [Hypholoma sublateritium FD-334 SS-4]
MLVRNTFLALVVLAYGGGAASVPGVADVVAGSTAAASSNITALKEVGLNIFGIEIGSRNQATVAWDSSLNPCSHFVPVAQPGAYECGRRFTISRQEGFTLEGCGGNMVIHQNGRLWGRCVRAIGHFACTNSATISTRLHCQQ